MIVVHDGRIPGDYIKAISRGFEDIRFLPFSGIASRQENRVYYSIFSHPDIYFFRLNENTIIHAPSLGQDYLSVLEDNGITLIKGDSDPSGAYPHTVPYNVVRIGRFVFHNFKHTDGVIVRYIEDEGLETINIEQGYARCSILPVGDRAIITGDRKTAERAMEKDIDAAVVKEGSILLPGEDHGFIGGTSGLLPGGDILFLGDITAHPDIDVIDDIMIRHGKKYHFLKDLPLYDAGSLFIHVRPGRPCRFFHRD